MKDWARDNYYLIILWILGVLAFVFFAGHYLEIFIDLSREVYYPQRILEGKVLYKDLFNIYGPASYQFNALLYKIFGTNLSTLYFMGFINMMLLLTGIYLVAKRYLNPLVSYSICVLTIAVCVLSANIHNFMFPYSWAMIYGLIYAIYSFYFLNKYRDTKNTSWLYLSSLFAGLGIVNKYEFILYGLIVSFFIVKEFIYDKRKGLISLGFIVMPAVISFGILFLQGMSFGDLFNSIQTTKEMAQSKTLAYLYQRMGVYFHPKAVVILIKEFIKTSIGVILLMLSAKLWERKKVFSIITMVVAAGYIFITFQNPSLAFVPILVLICAICNYKKLIEDKNLLLLVLFTYAVGWKVFFGLIYPGYGTYPLALYLITATVLLFLMIPEKYKKSIAIYFLIAGICWGYMQLYVYKHINTKITTEKGTIYSSENVGKATNELIEFIKNETSQTDKIVIYPEGMMINFLTDRESDDYYNSLLPLYVEVFGEKKIIEYFTQNKPEYFVFTNQKMSDYGFDYLCEDYGFGICGFVVENYNRIKTIDEGRRFLIFKKK